MISDHCYFVPRRSDCIPHCAKGLMKPTVLFTLSSQLFSGGGIINLILQFKKMERKVMIPQLVPRKTWILAYFA